MTISNSEKQTISYVNSIIIYRF